MRALRRIVLAGTACLLVIAAGRFAAGLEPTPSTGEGPFFPVSDGFESDADLTQLEGRTDAPQGDVFVLEGTVRDITGRSLDGAEVVIWQTDVWGKYRHPREERTQPDGSPLPLDPAFQYSGRTTADGSGHYAFTTIVPGTYGRRPRHIHMRVTHPDYRPLATEVHFAGDLWADEDVAGEEGAARAEHDRLAVELQPSSGKSAPHARFDIVLP